MRLVLGFLVLSASLDATSAKAGVERSSLLSSDASLSTHVLSLRGGQEDQIETNTNDDGEHGTGPRVVSDSNDETEPIQKAPRVPRHATLEETPQASPKDSLAGAPQPNQDIPEISSRTAEDLSQPRVLDQDSVGSPQPNQDIPQESSTNSQTLDQPRIDDKDAAVGSPQPVAEMPTEGSTMEFERESAKLEAPYGAKMAQSNSFETLTPPSETNGPASSKPGRGRLFSRNNILQRTTQQLSKTWKMHRNNEQSPLMTPERDHHHIHSLQSHLLGLPRAITDMIKRLPIGVLMSLLIHDTEHGGPTLLGMYVASLVGASCGFYLFLYFVSVGYAAGIGIPLSIALTHFVKTTNSQPSDLLVRGAGPWSKTQRTIVHSSLVVLWSIRMFLFLIWREYFNWPALHRRIVQVNQRPKAQSSSETDTSSSPDGSTLEDEDGADETVQIHNDSKDPSSSSEVQPQTVYPGPLVRIICWTFYSFFYLCMLSPCFFRMRHELNGAASATSGTIMAGDVAQGAENLALAMQVFGLLLETVADWQKSTFKSRLRSRYEWCGMVPGLSLWKWSTHPNYLGEGLFWLGTFLGGFTSLAAEYISTDVFFSPDLIIQGTIMAIGLLFIVIVLKGAILSLDQKHKETYATNPAYMAFRKSHGLFGRKWLVQAPQTTPESMIVSDKVETNLTAVSSDQD